MHNFNLFLFSYTGCANVFKHKPSGNDSGNADPTIGEDTVEALLSNTDPITQAKALLEQIKEKAFDRDEFDKLEELLKKAKGENESEKKELLRLIDDAIAADTSLLGGDRNQLKQLKEKWEEEYKNASEAHAKKTNATIAEAKSQAVPLKAETKDKLKGYQTQSVLEKEIQSLSKKYGSELNLNSALVLIRDNFTAIKDFSENDAFISSGDASRTSSAFEMALNKAGYVSLSVFGNGENNFTARELLAIIKFRDEITSNPQLQRSLGSVKVEKAVSVAKEYNPQNTDDIIKKLLDFNKDGKLTNANAKEYANNVVLAGLQRLFGGGNDAQLRIAGELQTYTLLSKQIGSDRAKLVDKIADITGYNIGEINEMLDIENGAEKLASVFQRKLFVETGKGGVVNTVIQNKEKRISLEQERAKEKAQAVENIKKGLESNDTGALIKQGFIDGGLPTPDATTVEKIMGYTSLRVYDLNPQFFSSVGVNTSVEKKTINYKEITHHIIRDITITKDSNGNEVSRTSKDRDGGTTTKERQEKSTSTKINPTLVIGFNQQIFGYENEDMKLAAGAGAAGVAKVDGVIFPLTLSADADVIISNTNNGLQTSNLSGNWVLGTRLSLSYVKGSGGVPSLGVNANWNDVINTVDKQKIRLENYLKKIQIDKTGNVDLTDIRKTFEEDKKNSSDNQAGLSEIEIMESFLGDLEQVINTAKDMSPEAKQMCLRENLQAFSAEYMASVRQGLDGIHLAGINITFIPFIHGIFFGFNLQHINQLAKNSTSTLTRKRDFEGNKKTINFEDPALKDILKQSGDNILVSKEDVPLRATIKEGVTQTEQEGGLLLSPGKGEHLEVNHVAHTLENGMTISVIHISSEKNKTKSEKKREIAEQASNDTMTNFYEQSLFTPEDHKRIFALSRSNKTVINAFNAIIRGEFGHAKNILAQSKDKSLHFIQKRLDGKNDEQVLRNMLLSSSGSRDTRALKDNITKAQMVKSYRQAGNAFTHRLIESADKLTGDQTKELTQSHKASVKDLIGKLDAKTNKTVPISSMIGSGYRDMVGSITFSQIGVDKKTTAKGLFNFNGNIETVGKYIEVTDDVRRAIILKNAEKSGGLQKNLDAVNTFLKGKKLPEMTMDEYKTVLLGKGFPSGYKGEVSFVKNPQFLHTSAALPGATCLNDVLGMAIPSIRVGTEVEKTTEITGASAFSGNTADALENEGKMNSATVGMNFSETVTNVIAEKASEITVITPKETIVDLPESSTTVVEGEGSTTVEGEGSTTVEGEGSTTVEGEGSTTVEGEGSTTVEGEGSTTVEGEGSTTVEGEGSTTVEGEGSNTITTEPETSQSGGETNTGESGSGSNE